MKTKICIFLLLAISVAQSAPTPSPSAHFDVLSVAPTPTISAQSADVEKARVTLRDTYTSFLSIYQRNAQALMEARLSLTSAQFTEIVTVQWGIFNILKSIHPALDLEAPPATQIVPARGPVLITVPTPKPPATPKKK